MTKQTQETLLEMMLAYEPTAEQLAEIERHGREAYEDGQAADENPHFNERMVRAWEKGWFDACHEDMAEA